MVTIRNAKRGEPDYFGSWDEVVKYARAKGDGFNVRFKAKDGDTNNDLELDIIGGVKTNKE